MFATAAQNSSAANSLADILLHNKTQRTAKNLIEEIKETKKTGGSKTGGSYDGATFINSLIRRYDLPENLLMEEIIKELPPKIGHGTATKTYILEADDNSNAVKLKTLHSYLGLTNTKPGIIEQGEDGKIRFFGKNGEIIDDKDIAKFIEDFKEILYTSPKRYLVI